MITAQINDHVREYPGTTTILDIVAEQIGRELHPSGSPVDGKRLGVAVALRGEVLPRSQWSVTALTTGDTVEIVTAVQGG